MARKSDIQYIQFYTDGSAARKLELVTPRQKPERKPAPPRPRRRRRIIIRVDPVALGGILLSAVLLFAMGSGVRELRAARQDVRQMERYVQVLEADNAMMEKTISEGYDLNEVEEQALALGLVPEAQVDHIAFRDEIPEQPEQLSFWQQIRDFFSELFA